MTGTGSRRSRRLSSISNGNSSKSNGQTNGNDKRNGSSKIIEEVNRKKRKIESSEERISKLITKHNLLVNELFNLKEYKSIYYWDPSLYSSTKVTQLPEIYEDFCKNPEYELSWSDDPKRDQKQLDSVPLRMQRKILAEREAKLLKEFPFKKEAIKLSQDIEERLLDDIDVVFMKEKVRQEEEERRLEKEKKIQEAKKKQQEVAQEEEGDEVEEEEKEDEIEEEEEEEEEEEADDEEVEKEIKEVTPIKRGRSKTPLLPSASQKLKAKPVKVLIEENLESEEASSDEDLGTNYKLKAMKYTMAPPLVTHPSHIPAWKPSIENMSHNDNEDKDTIIPFNATTYKVIIDKDGDKTTFPSIQDKLHNFLENNYKSAIIDDQSMDYNNTPAEYENIMTQQEDLITKLYEKIYIEKRLELHGDKVEPRKTVLPHTNSKASIDPFRANDLIITAKSVQGSVPNATHQDILLTQGMAFSKLHQQTRRSHTLKTRKIAQMIDLYFKKKAGEKERQEKERELNLKKMSRIAAQAVKRRWIQASKVYRHLQQQEEEELKRIKGREHLSQMLEHSTQLLEAQLSKPAAEEVEDSDDESDQSSLDSDHHFSSSSDESEAEESDKEEGEKDQQVDNSAPGEQGDENLTVDELKLKYKEMSESQVSSNTNSSEDEDEDEDINVNDGLSALYGGKGEVSTEATPILEYTEEQKDLIKSIADDKKMTVLDDQESSDSLSESDTTGSDTDSSEVESDSEVEKKPSSLSALFSNGNIEANDSSDEDVSDSESNSNSDDENMSETTDEEDEPKTPKPHEELNGGTEEIVEEEINGAKVRDVPVPSLLRGTLRPYQKQGLNWLASLYNNNTNGILADEMGLGKTIQTISLLSYLACEHHIWGPHLIIVPTSVMLNWEMEFKKFAPGFKVITYYGTPQQRAAKRKGWNKPDAFHVCITSYQLVVHDHQSFKRRRWKYMILDEAHNIKNFRSTRWRALLNFNTENRLLLTGTPLQNNLMELWSLLYFLMPSSKVNQAMPEGFANLDDFQQWFGKPVDRILEQTTMGGSANDNADLIDENVTSKMDSETRNTVSRLHQVLRPYLLRRLKKDVEKQMPGKYEHIVYCRLSKRQRYLYDDFMSRAKTKETLASGSFLSIINCLMQLRKVCNHPDLFEVRPIVTSFAMPNCVSSKFEEETNLIERRLKESESYRDEVSLSVLNLDITNAEDLNVFTSKSLNLYKSIKGLEAQIQQLDELIDGASKYKDPQLNDYLEYYKFIKLRKQAEVKSHLEHVIYINNLRCSRKPIYGESLLRQIQDIGLNKFNSESKAISDIVLSVDARTNLMSDAIEKFSVLTPSVVALDMKDQIIPVSTQYKVKEEVATNAITNPFHQSQVKLSIAFPDKSLLQYDCGKLQRLATLLQDLIAGGHRALIFTQMTKVLDILEQFLNIHGYRYMRLDGSTKIEDRQLLTEKFNRDNKIPVFILSTRSGGLGINLTGADTVIFYDSDWNPAMDKQCQDRCHRIGQSRDVHIYRFVSEYTIESNILKKANQKRQLDNVVIQEGEFTTDYFGKLSVKDLVGAEGGSNISDDKPIGEGISGNISNVLAQAEDEDDRTAANAAMKEIQVDDEDFDEESKSATTGGTPALGTPGPETSTGRSATPANDPVVGSTDLADVDFEDGVGHVDEYMLRFISEGNWD